MNSASQSKPIEDLKKFGFSSKEAEVYLALLELGSSPASEVAKLAQVKRSTTYVFLEELLAKGLVGVSKVKGVSMYTPSPPDRLIQFAEDNAKKSADLVWEARTIVSELRGIYSGVGPKPKVQVFEGAEGIKTTYEDTLKSSEPIRAYASVENIEELLPSYLPEYYKRRARKGIKIRAIFPDTEEARNRRRYDQEEERESVLVSAEEYAFSPEINIYDNKIAFMSVREKFGVIIESAELAGALKTAFELSWIGAKAKNGESGN